MKGEKSFGIAPVRLSKFDARANRRAPVNLQRGQYFFVSA
jgi:hypothetical protein